MTFDEWFHKEYEPADLQIKQCAERKESIQASAKVYLEDLKKAFEAGRPKWHKVADGDLPSEEGGWVCNQDGLPCFFDWGTEQWLECEGTQIRTTEWCHMPHKE